MKPHFYKPSRPYKNFADFLRQHGQRKEIEYPCLVCCGNKIIIDPDEVPDIIEGHKLSRRIKCPSCNGSGASTVKVLRQQHKKEMDAYRIKFKQWQEKTGRLKKILKKLTKEELDMLDRAFQGCY